MTYKDYIAKTVARFNLSESDVELILLNQQEAIPDADAEVDVTTAKRAICKEFAVMLPLANVSEGGYSVSWNWDALKAWYNATCSELGLSNYTRPQVRNKSFLW